LPSIPWHPQEVQAKVRPALFDAYWRFAASRQAIFERRWAGSPAPWTDDPILRRYKFCNTFRAADRVTQYLLSEVIYHPECKDLRPEDVFCRVVLFRLFSKPETWQALDTTGQRLTAASLDPDVQAAVLDRLKQRQAIYTSAFILAPPSQNLGSKHLHHLRLVKRMFSPGGVGRVLARARSLHEVVDALLGWPTIGPFLAYQIAIDLNYSPHLRFSENDFTLPGPGAERGLRKVFSDPRGRSGEQLILDMVEDQDSQFNRLGLSFRGLFGRPLHAIDCQGLFCEIDKYSRVAFPELKSGRTRIKQSFRPTGPLPSLVFPAHWELTLPAPPKSAVDLTRPRARNMQLALELLGPRSVRW
jgi:alpha-glutamyl/putrescinyl thymine pyrophosphorylase clade 1